MTSTPPPRRPNPSERYDPNPQRPRQPVHAPEEGSSEPSPRPPHDGPDKPAHPREDKH